MMSKIKLYSLIGLFIILIMGCTREPEHSNPFDPLNPSYLGTGIIKGKILEAVMILIDPPPEYPIAGAEVIARQNGDTKGSTISDTNGMFILSDLLAGNYDLTINASGYKTKTINNVSVIANRTIELNIELIKE